MIKNPEPVHNLLFRYGIWPELANLFRILAELLLLSLWIFALSLQQLNWKHGFFTISMIYFGSYFLSRILKILKEKLHLQRIYFFIWVLISLAFSTVALLFNNISLNPREFLMQIFREELTPETIFGFWVLFFSVISILRAVQVARYPVSVRELTSNLRISLIFFSAFAIIFGRSQLPLFLPGFLFYMLFILLGLSLARISDLSDTYGSRLPGFTPQWAAGIGLAAILVVVVGLGVSQIINLQVAKFFGRGLVVLLQLFFGAVVLITSPILLALLSVIRFLISLLAPNLGQLLDPAEMELGNQFLDDMQNQITDVTRTDPRLFVMIAVLALIIVLAIIQLRWNPFQRLARREEGASDLEINFKLPKNIRDLFPNRLRRKQRRSARSLIMAARIRYVYAQLMDLCDKLGKPRPRSLTPIEFLGRMHNIFPMHGAELSLITNAYVKIRYGELPETQKDIDEVMTAWKKVSQFGKEILDERRRNLRRTASRP